MKRNNRAHHHAFARGIRMNSTSLQSSRPAMQKSNWCDRVIAALFGIAMLTFAGWASADPPTRVARLGYISGAVSFSPAGENR